MQKRMQIYYLLGLGVLGLIILVILLTASFGMPLVAQSASNKSIKSIDLTNQESILSHNNNTFNATGKIATLFYIISENAFVTHENALTTPGNMAMPMSGNRINHSGSESHTNATNIHNPNLAEQLNTAIKTTCEGDWNMVVEKGKVVNFTSPLECTNDDGTAAHTHLLKNFKQDNSTRVELTPGYNTNIKGSMDIELNSKIVWPNVRTTIEIAKGNAIVINLDNNATANHFKQQPLYGIVDTINNS